MKAPAYVLDTTTVLMVESIAGNDDLLNDPNHSVFQRRDVVRFYANHDTLQGGERAVLALIEPDLPSLAVLDLGVGGGRTTAHFAPRARKYLGVDYAPAMIAAAKQRFAGEKWSFEVADARKLPLSNATFDFALFSHCGIDYVDHPGRLAILEEVRRVLVSGSTFSMSTHNLQRARELLEGPANEARLLRAVRWLGRRRLRRSNPPLAEIERTPHAVINDGAFRHAVRTYHIRPRAQIEQLTTAGFDDVRVLSAKSGEPLTGDLLDRNTEPWLMYVCRRT